MRKTLVMITAIFLAVSSVAQVRTGNIRGRVTDSDGKPLPGVSVTLTSEFTAPMTALTSAKGVFSFLSLPPGKNYNLKLELTGFKTHLEKEIIVGVGTSTNLKILMESGGIEEYVTSTAITPTIDQMKTAAGTNVTREILQKLPTARDPWAILQMVPSILVDRENVGGAESGQQSKFVARGSKTAENNVWAMDGVVVTDPSATGESITYYDFDAIEEMQITVGGADVTVQTSGTALNLVTRRGGNKLSLEGRFYYTDKNFQAANAAKIQQIKDREQSPGFYGINRIRSNSDYGINLGFPVFKDKFWAWFAYGVQEINTNTVYGTPDDSSLTNYAGKINLQVFPENRLEIFFQAGNKKKWGYSSSAQNPEGLQQQSGYRFGAPIMKIQDELSIGKNIFLSFKFSYLADRFSRLPMTDIVFNKVPVWDMTAERYYGSQAPRHYSDRSVHQYSFLTTYFKDKFLGVGHEFKFGAEFSTRKQYIESVWNGNLKVSRNFRPTDETWDWTGDEIPDGPVDADVKKLSFWRGYYRGQRVKSITAFLSDTVTLGRFNATLGLRFDWQQPHNAPFKLYAVDDRGTAWSQIAEPEVQTALRSLLPDLNLPARYVKTYNLVDNQLLLASARYAWKVFSPRISVVWDIIGNGKMLAKLSAAQYGDYMGTGMAGWADAGGTGGWMDFWWWDTSRDNKVQLNELYWFNARQTPYYSLYPVFDQSGTFIGNWEDAAGYFWDAYDPSNPQGFTEPYTSTLKSVGSSRTSEILFSLEGEIFKDFSVSLVSTYRKYDKFNWALKYWQEEDGTIKVADYTYFSEVGKPEARYYRQTPAGLSVYIPDTKGAKNYYWYAAKAAYNVYSPYSLRQPHDWYYMDYLGFDLIVNKRLSRKWMLNGSFTWQRQAQHFGSGSYINSTNIWAFEGRPQAAYAGGYSGKIDQYIYSPWMFKISGLYQLRYGIDISGTFNMRRGWVQNEYFTLVDYRLPATLTRSVDLILDYFGSQHLPLFYNFSVRVEKVFRVGDSGRIYLMLDVFNVLNKMIENRRYQKYWGTVRIFPSADSTPIEPGEAGYPLPIDWTRTTFTPYIYKDALNEVLNPRVARLGIRFQF